MTLSMDKKNHQPDDSCKVTNFESKFEDHTMNTETKDRVVDLVKTLNDGIHFYSSAKKDISDPVLASIFTEMLSVKIDFRAKLKECFDSSEDFPSLDDKTLGGKLRESYTRLSAKVVEDKSTQYIKHLEEVEDKVLDVFNDLSSTTQDADLVKVIKQSFPAVIDCHNKMKSIKQIATA